MKDRQITIRMPKEDLEQWLADLRDPANQDKQGRGALFDGKGYCCLGLAQVRKTGGKVEAYPHRPLVGEHGWREVPTTDWLQSVGWSFSNHRGEEASDPWLSTANASAAGCNDGSRCTFAEIADHIEACAEGY